MNLSSMSDRDRRALFWGIAILVPSLVFVFGVKPFLATLGQNRDQLSVERETLSRSRAAVAAALENPDLQRIADSAMRAMKPRLFEGRDDVMATAELVSHLGAVAMEHHVLLQDAATRPTKVSDGGVRELHVEIRAESDLQGLLRFLAALESDEKLLRVERLDITRTMANRDADGVEPISIAASIVGFAIREGASQPTVAASGRTARGAR